MLKSLLKWSGLILAAVFVLFSIIPYLVPPGELPGNRYQMAFANSKFASEGGAELHYRHWEGNGRANVLLVHGLGGSTFSWRYTAPALEDEGYRVIAVDLPGFGLSERAGGLDHSSTARAERLWFFLEDSYPGEDWHLVGHSMGGATVTDMALQKPQNVVSLILVAGALAEFEPTLFDSLLQYPPVSRWVRLLAPEFFLSENRIENALENSYGRKPTAEEFAGYYKPLTVEGTDAVLADLVKTAPTPLLHRVEELELPVLCIWGEDDAVVPLERGERLNRMIPGSELAVMEGEGHCPMETLPDEFNSLMLNFLNRVESPSGN